jgi:hypothetical protein
MALTSTTRTTIGRALLTFVVAVFPIAGALADWNRSHLFNPAWHPHAKYHGLSMLLIVICVSAVAIWLLWRRSLEPQVGIKVAVLVSLILWTPFLYAVHLVPGSSLWVGDPADPVPYPQLAGMILYPQMVLAVIFLLLTAGGYALARRGDATS